MPSPRSGGEGARFPGRQRPSPAPAGLYKRPERSSAPLSATPGSRVSRPCPTMRFCAARSALPALLALLGALLPGPGDATLTVIPREATIPRGGNLKVNCSDSCALLGMETPLDKQELEAGATWKVFLLSNLKENSRPLCFSNCGHQPVQSVEVTVYWFPENVVLEPLPSWQPVGETFTLNCLIDGGAPRNNLTAVLLRGDEVLSRQPVPGLPEDKDVVVMATVQARREDHGANFSCRTELDLRPGGLELFMNSSAPRQLQTFVLPETLPSLAAPTLVEVGTEQTVKCILDGLFPVSEAKVELMLGDNQLNSSVKYHNDSIIALAQIEAAEEGEQQLQCTLSLGTKDRRNQKSLIFYRFQTPHLSLNPPEVSEGKTVMVVCEAQPDALVTLPGTSSSFRINHFTFNASAEDHGRTFSCFAQLEVAGQKLLKNQTQRLNVLYGPLLEPRDCPRNWTWEEGSHQTLWCQPRGNPNPRLECLRKDDKAPLPIGDLRPVKQEIQGTYVCQATSSQGVITTEVVLTVISNHSNHFSIIIGVVALLVVLAVLTGVAYWVNRRRKIKKYKLQKAQEEAAMKLNMAAGS